MKNHRNKRLVKAIAAILILSSITSVVVVCTENLILGLVVLLFMLLLVPFVIASIAFVSACFTSIIQDLRMIDLLEEIDNKMKHGNEEKS